MSEASDSAAGLQRLAEAADVEFAYALALGRAPESEAARDGWLAAMLSVGAVLFELLTSSEFAEAVVKPLVDDTVLDTGRFAAPFGRTARAWAAGLFEVEGEAPRTWLDLLLRLHASGALQALGESFGDPQIGSDLAHLMERRRRGEAGGAAALIAGVDTFDGERLTGWALDLADPDRALRLELWIDGRFARTLAPHRFRRDLQDRYGGGGRVGFDAALPLSAADTGRRLRLEVRDPAGRVLAQTAGAAGGVARLDALASVKAELEAVRAVLERIERAIPDLRARTAFTLAGWNDYAQAFYSEPASAAPAQRTADGADLPEVNVRLRRGSGSATSLEAALASLVAQEHPRWTALIAPDVLDDPGQLSALVDACAPGSSVRIAAADDSASEAALTIFMSATDRLAPDALATFARVFAADPQARLLYADDDRMLVTPGGGRLRSEPRLKPPYDPYLLLQENYIGAIYAADTTLLAHDVGDGGNHARLLRLAHAAGREGVRHIPRILAHVGALLNEAPDAAAVAVQLASEGLRAAVEPHADVVGARRRSALRLRPQGLEGVTASVIVSTRDRLDLLRPCVESLERSRGANRVLFELMVVDNGGVEAAACAYLKALEGRSGVRVVRDPAPFNWAAINTRAALQASGEVLVFLNDDTLVVSPEWCDELCLWALTPRVGAVGARLLYDDGTIQHAGVVMGRGGSARHEGVGEPGGEGGYLGRRQLVHATSAVTGACLATRAEVFRRMDGFDAGRFAVAFNDMDYCLRLGEAGLDVVYTPHATFTHFESKSRGFGDLADRAEMGRAREELDAFQSRHADALQADRWMNPHFEREAPAFTALTAPPPAP